MENYDGMFGKWVDVYAQSYFWCDERRTGMKWVNRKPVAPLKAGAWAALSDEDKAPYREEALRELNLIS